MNLKKAVLIAGGIGFFGGVAGTTSETITDTYRRHSHDSQEGTFVEINGEEYLEGFVNAHEDLIPGQEYDYFVTRFCGHQWVNTASPSE